MVDFTVLHTVDNRDPHAYEVLWDLEARLLYNSEGLYGVDEFSLNEPCPRCEFCKNCGEAADYNKTDCERWFTWSDLKLYAADQLQLKEPDTYRLIHDLYELIIRPDQFQTIAQFGSLRLSKCTYDYAIDNILNIEYYSEHFGTLVTYIEPEKLKLRAEKNVDLRYVSNFKLNADDANMLAMCKFIRETF